MFSYEWNASTGESVITCTLCDKFQKWNLNNERAMKRIVEGITPDTPTMRHGPHHQGWFSLQDQGTQCTALVDMNRKTFARYLEDRDGSVRICEILYSM